MRAWLAITLLSASWLFGLSYYQAANLPLWAILVSAGSALLWNTVKLSPLRTETAVAAGILAIGLVVGLSPFDLPLEDYVSFVPLALLAVGLGARVALPGQSWMALAGETLTASGLVLLVQRIAMFGYEVVTARSHELPTILAFVVGGMAKLLSLDAAQFGTTVSLHSMRELHRLGATWELLLDPASLSFWVGGLAWLAISSRRRISASGKFRVAGIWAAVKPACVFSTVMAVWLPVRVGSLLALYMHLGLRLDFDDQPEAMILFWQPWLHGMLLLVPAIVAWLMVARDGRGAAESGNEMILAAQVVTPLSKRATAMALAALAAIAIGFGLWWDPIGERKPGTVLVDEFHIGHSPRSGKLIHWEPTTRPYDTEWYGQDAAYNYACIYDYLTHYYDVHRLEPKNRPEGMATDKPAGDSILIDRINSTALRDCDVLVIKNPTADYSPTEVQAIKRFVERGGGLLLVGEHTDVFGTGRHLNTLAQEFGFKFRYDCVFGIDHDLPEAREFPVPASDDGAPKQERKPPRRTVFDQNYHRPWVPHPVLQDMPPLDFATSASVDPGSSDGRAIIRSTGLWNLPADYHADNYYPQVVWRPDMRYGAFVQLWSTRFGEGRVLAFTDSTIFSNFSAFQPGKPELMVGMIEWLNHRNAWLDPRPWLFALALSALVVTIYLAYNSRGAKLALLATGAGAFLLTAPAVRAIHRAGMPTPLADESQITRVIFDRTVSDAQLPNGSFIDGRENGFGIFERWMLRLGYFAQRGAGEEALRGDVVVVVNPKGPIPPQFQARVEQFVSDGGKLLIVDSTLNDDSTANDLLAPFDIEMDDGPPISGMLTNEHKWPSVPVKRVKKVRGGSPLFRVGDTVAGSVVNYGKGTVVVIGFGDRFSDANMGVTGDTVPDAEMRKVYDVQYGSMRWIVDGQ